MYAEGYMVDGGRYGTPVRVRAASQCTQQANQQNCEANSCNVQIGSNVYCSQCKTGGNVPIDGVCTAKDNATDKCMKDGSTPIGESNTKYGFCPSGYFLHKGGCYKKGQQPGQTICTDTSSTLGPCESCASGYFNNPAATDNTKESCIACGDTTGDTTNSNKGVQNCATCTVEGAGTTGKTAKCISIANPSRETSS
ncbi:VSP [Giardia duodenalis ATCC 50581]|uniref:VSP n=1 Tax=Giardia intestinalis (strain ATCC 50581 / GS clone H7) TaxID=598745 RepID=C6LT91_GIAIB|nr:VSP [Giardia intestinalis ATCC 50581]